MAGIRQSLNAKLLLLIVLAMLCVTAFGAFTASWVTVSESRKLVRQRLTADAKDISSQLDAMAREILAVTSSEAQDSDIKFKIRSLMELTPFDPISITRGVQIKLVGRLQTSIRNRRYDQISIYYRGKLFAYAAPDQLYLVVDGEGGQQVHMTPASPSAPIWFSPDTWKIADAAPDIQANISMPPSPQVMIAARGDCFLIEGMAPVTVSYYDMEALKSKETVAAEIVLRKRISASYLKAFSTAVGSEVALFFPSGRFCSGGSVVFQSLSESAAQDIIRQERFLTDYNIKNERYYGLLKPYFYDKKLVGLIGVFQTKQFIAENTKKIILFQGAGLTLGLLFIVLIALLVRKFITNPVIQVSRQMKEIAADRGFDRKIKVSSSDEIGALAASFNEMTANLQKAYSELQKSEERFRVLVEKAPEAILVYDVDAGRLCDANKNAELLFGCSREELLLHGPRRFYAINQPDGLPIDESFQINNGQALAGQEVVFERLVCSGDKKEKHCEVRLVNLPSADRRLLRASYVDITPRIRAEEEKEKLQAQLIMAQKMESVGRLAGGVAHDFNNMLGVILGYADLALDVIDPKQPLYANLQEIKKAAERSADLTRQLLAFARKQTAVPRALDLNETVEGMLKMLRRLIGEDIDLVWLPGKDLWPINIDPSQIDQILANLCINARDAIGGGGKITIETRCVVIDEAYCSDHRGFVPGQYVLLAVSDNGCGMDPETLLHLFEPFFTTKTMGKGTGLGLATIYGIVKQNKGFVNVYSEPGMGATFKIYLPRHTGRVDQVLQIDSAKAAAFGHETILLVEDETAILSMTTRMLKQLGYTVLGAAQPSEAIRMAEQYSAEINLLISDVILQEMNGRDLAKHLLSVYPNLRCMFISGYTADVIAHHGVLNKGVHFLEKPFSLKALADKVREVLDAPRIEAF